MTFFTDPVSVVTDGMTFLEGCGVWSGSVVDNAECCDDRPDCFDYDEPGDCDIYPEVTFLTEPVNMVSPGVTYHETDDVLDGSGYEYDNYVGNRLDCVDCANPDDFDSYPDVTFPPEPVNVVTPGVAYQENSVVLGGSVSAYVDYSGDRTKYLDCDELGGCDGGPGVTLLAEPVEVVTEGMTYQEKIDILSGSVYDYDDYYDNCPDYFDNDDPGDFDDVYGFVEPVEYGMWDGLHGPDGPGGEDNSYQTGSGDPIAGVVSTSGPDGTGDGTDRPHQDP